MQLSGDRGSTVACGRESDAPQILARAEQVFCTLATYDEHENSPLIVWLLLQEWNELRNYNHR